MNNNGLVLDETESDMSVEEATQILKETIEKGEVIADEDFPDDALGQTEPEDISTYSLSGVDAFIWESFLNLLQSGENGQKEIAAARMANLQNVTQLIKEHSTIVGHILFLCERFEIKVRTTTFNGLEPMTGEMPIVQHGRYDLNTIQMALANLLNKFSRLHTLEKSQNLEISTLESKVMGLGAEKTRLSAELYNLKQKQEAPFVPVPFVLARIIHHDEKPMKMMFIGKNEQGDYLAVGKLGDALRYSSPEKATAKLIELMDQYRSVAIKNLAKYDVVSLRYLRMDLNTISSDLALGLTKARERATLNKA